MNFSISPLSSLILFFYFSRRPGGSGGREGWGGGRRGRGGGSSSALSYVGGGDWRFASSILCSLSARRRRFRGKGPKSYALGAAAVFNAPCTHTFVCCCCGLQKRVSSPFLCFQAANAFKQNVYTGQCCITAIRDLNPQIKVGKENRSL